MEGYTVPVSSTARTVFTFSFKAGLGISRMNAEYQRIYFTTYLIECVIVKMSQLVGSDSTVILT